MILLHDHLVLVFNELICVILGHVLVVLATAVDIAIKSGRVLLLLQQHHVLEACLLDFFVSNLFRKSVEQDSGLLDLPVHL